MDDIKMVDLDRQYREIKEEIWASFEAVLNSSAFIKGPQVAQLERALEEYTGAKQVIGCGNGTDALQIALMALDLKPGDEVITTPFTFVATVEVIALLGLVPVFADIDPSTFNIDTEKIEALIGPRTKVILPVHLFGQSANMQDLTDLANSHGLYVIEDNAQSMGAEVRMRDGVRKAGTVGHIGTTSFFPSKNLGAYGDGGALFTSDEKLGDAIRQIANHGSSKRYHYERVGVNSRLDSLQAAVLLVKLKRLDTYNEKRQRAAGIYDQLLSEVEGVIRPFRAEHTTHVFHQYTLRIKSERDRVVEALKERRIPFGIYYPIPLHLHRAYDRFGYRRGDLPVSEKMAEEVLSLPMHTHLTVEQQEYIATTVKKALD